MSEIQRGKTFFKNEKEKADKSMHNSFKREDSLEESSRTFV